MIKFYFRKSIFYFLIYEIIYYIRFIEVMLLDLSFSFNDSTLLTFLMALGEIFGGLLLYLFVRGTFRKNKKTDYFGIQLIKIKSNKIRKDGSVKIIILIFLAAFFDDIQFLILNSILYPINNISKSINNRYSNIKILTGFFLCKYSLKLSNGRHQTFSIICMSILLSLQIIIEIGNNYKFNNFFISFFINILNLFFNSFDDIIEKYLGDTSFSIPYIITMGEGIFIFIINSIYSIVVKSPFVQIKKLYNELDSVKFGVLVFLLVLYLILSAIINVYKIHCNIFTTPVKRAFIHYILSPFYIIYTFFCKKDFRTNEGEENIPFIIISEIFSILFLFLGLVYDEYIILLFFGLGKDTIYDIRKRAKKSYESIGSEYDFDGGGYGVNFNNYENDEVLM